TMKSRSFVSSGWNAAVKWIVGSSIWMTLAPAAASWRSSTFMAVAMSQISCFLSSRSYSDVWLSRKIARTCDEQVPNLTGLPGALLIGDHGRVGVEELLAETDVEQRRVERPAPQSAVVPARPWPRAGDGSGQHQVLGCREHRACASLEYAG